MKGVARDMEGVARDTLRVARDMKGVARDTFRVARDMEGVARDMEGVARDTLRVARDMEGVARDTRGSEENGKMLEWQWVRDAMRLGAPRHSGAVASVCSSERRARRATP